jgi:hypothetical protein
VKFSEARLACEQLGNKDDLTPSPKRSSSNRGCLTGETNDVVSSYGFALNRAGFSHSPDTPSLPQRSSELANALKVRTENGSFITK